MTSSVKKSSMMKSVSTLFLAALLFAPALHATAQEPQAPVAASQQPVSQTEDGKIVPPDSKAEKKEAQEDENEKYLQSPTVKWLGAKLGMDPREAGTVFTIANFLVLAVLVGWFLIKTLPKTFRDRTSAIQKHLVDARTATEEASARLNTVEDRLSKLDGQIAAMRAQAEKDSAAEEQRIKAGIEEEKQKILAAAEQEIAAATALAQRQLQQHAAELAIEQAARKLVVTAETDRLLVQNFARRLADDKGGQN